MIKHLNIKIFGKVQGVFFRATAREQAERLGILGFAKNMPDGSVYIEVEGEESKLDQFLDWCKTGPLLAMVEKIATSKGQLKNFSEFLI